MAFACERCRSGKRKCDATKPECSLCQRLGKPCVYLTEKRNRKRKYWDEEYVHGLEQQVQALLAAVKQAGHSVPSTSQLPGLQEVTDQITHDAPFQQIPDANSTHDHGGFLGQERSQTAMEELSVMMWRTNLGDGAAIVNDDKTAAAYDFNDGTSSTDGEHMDPPPEILHYAEDADLMSKLATTFLDCVNQEHQFTQYKSTSFLENYPHQTRDEVFLHTALLAVGAAFLSASSKTMARISSDFSKYAERLVFECCKSRPTLAVIQGICMLSFRSLSLGKDHIGWMFISMAGGLCVHLRLHVLAVEECAARSLQPNSPEIRTFWMYYFIDKSAITILGRNCALPWRRVNVPDFDSTFDPEIATVHELSFSWQCRLWYAHDGVMDEIFAPAFETKPVSQQVGFLVSTIDQLNTFFQSKPSRLNLSQHMEKPVLLFHLQFHMAILVTVTPFLRLFSISGTVAKDKTIDSSSNLLVLRSITSAASDTIRLVRVYRNAHGFEGAHPILVHHLLSSSLVHLMNATTQNVPLHRQSTRWLRQCLGMLTELRNIWPLRANKSIKVIRVLAQKWNVVSSLPIEFTAPIEPSTGQARGLPEDFEEGDSSFDIQNPDEPSREPHLDAYQQSSLSALFPSEESASSGGLSDIFEELGEVPDFDNLFTNVDLDQIWSEMANE